MSGTSSTSGMSSPATTASPPASVHAADATKEAPRLRTPRRNTPGVPHAACC